MTSSGVSLTDKAATASSRCWGLVAPTMGAVTHRLVQQPRQCHLRPRHAAPACDLGDPLDDFAIGLGRFGIQRLAELVRLRARAFSSQSRVSRPRAKRTPGDDADLLSAAQSGSISRSSSR